MNGGVRNLFQCSAFLRPLSVFFGLVLASTCAFAQVPGTICGDGQLLGSLSYNLSVLPQHSESPIAWKAPPSRVEGPLMAILILIDGARQDLFDRFVAEGKMPNVKKLFYDQGWVVKNCITIWPSTSVPAHSSITTGSYPDKHGVIGQRWFDPQKKYYRNYIGPGALQIRGDLNEKVRTVFEHVRGANKGAVSVLELSARGASLFIPGMASDKQVLGNILRLATLGRIGGKIPLIGAASQDKGTGMGFIPRFIMGAWPEVDHVHHGSLTQSDEVTRLYHHLDEQVARMADYLEKNGLLDRCFIVLTSDHGMGDVHQSLSIQDLLVSEGLKVFFPKLLGYELGNCEGMFSTIAPDSFDAFACWGGNSDMLLYLKGTSKDGTGNPVWGGKVDRTILEAYPRPGKKPLNLLQRLLSEKAIDIVAYKEAAGRPAKTTPSGRIAGYGAPDTPPSLDGRFRFESKSGSSLLIGSSEQGWNYKVITGHDPFGYDKEHLLKLLSCPRSEEQWLEITCEAAYPNAPIRLAHALSHPTRSPHLALVSADGYDFIPSFLKIKIPGSHGGLIRTHSVVPFMFRGPGLTPNMIRYARTVDVVPTVMGLLGIPLQPGVLDGKDIRKISEPGK